MISEIFRENYIIVVILAATFALYFTYTIFKKTPTVRYPPGPKGYPVIGIVTPVSHKTLWNHLDLYGECSFINVFGTKILVLNTIESVVDAFQSPKYAGCFDGRPEMFFGRYVMHTDVAFRNPDDPYWHKQRNLISSYIIAHGEQKAVIEQVITEELSVVKNFLAPKSSNNEEFDLYEFLAPSLVNIIFVLLIGKRFDYKHEVMTVIHNQVKSSNSLMEPSGNFFLMTFPTLRYLPFGLGSQYRATKHCFKQLFKIVLDDARETLKLHGDECNGMVYDLLRRQEHSPWITDDIIKGTIQDIVGVANSTTKFSLYSLFLVLVHHPHIQAIIQREIDDVIGKENSPNITDRRLMPYTEATLVEMSRYCAIAPLSIPHVCNCDAEFRGFTVPKGTIVMANYWRIHFDESWGNPWEFDPQRFLDEEGHLLPASHPIRKRFVPFGVGKRHCIGETFAKNRMFLYITNILQHFTLLPGDDLPSCDPREFICDQNLYPAPYRVRVKQRASSTL